MRAFIVCLLVIASLVAHAASPAKFPAGITVGNASIFGSSASPASTSILEMVSSTKGLLIPRQTTAQRTGIGSPAEGLLVWDTDLNSLFQYTGAAWQQMATLTGTETLTNKTIDADLNTIQNIDNGEIKAAAAIALNKLAATTASRALISDSSGFVSASDTTSTQVGYLSTATSNIQTQLDAKQARSTLTTKGDLYCATGAGAVTRLAVGADGFVATADSAQTCGIAWSAPASAPVSFAPVVRTFSTAGSGTYHHAYAFAITTGSASSGTTYTNNGVTFTVVHPFVTSTQAVLIGSSAPASSGTLTRTAGTGADTLTFSEYRAPIALRVMMVGGGGGGGGGGTTSGSAATAGSATTFGTALLSAGGGAAGTRGGYGTDGGTSSIAAPLTTGIATSGGRGGPGTQYLGVAATPLFTGGNGGNSVLGGGGNGGSYANTGAGSSAPANTGGGGGGGGVDSVNNGATGAGGGAGGYVDTIISSIMSVWSTSFAYTVGAGGTGQAAGTDGAQGGNGAAGLLQVTSFYQ